MVVYKGSLSLNQNSNIDCKSMCILKDYFYIIKDRHDYPYGCLYGDFFMVFLVWELFLVVKFGTLLPKLTLNIAPVYIFFISIS